MMPRARPRCVFLYFLGVCTSFLLIFNVHQVFYSFPLPPSIQNTGPDSTDASRIHSDNKPRGEEKQSVLMKRKFSGELSVSRNTNSTLEDQPMVPPTNLPYYMKDGSIKPISPVGGESRKKRNLKLFPEEDPTNDRIIDQLMFVPPQQDGDPGDSDAPLKTILAWGGLAQWGGVKGGRGEFLKQNCPVSTCALTNDRNQKESADLILFKDSLNKPDFLKPPNQIWMLYMLECPLHTGSVLQPDLVNWTATYRSDSTIVTPYEKWVYYDDTVKARTQQINYAAGKTKKVAIFVSNCGARNGRLQYARELANHIQVDIYGSCGNYSCPRTAKCFKMLDTDYKFYLAFENSNCKDYITEKFFVNGLGHNVLPIVMGASPEEYTRQAPQHSFIHVDQFKGPRELAEYLLELDRDEDKYNEYFQWKGTGEFINTRFFCRVCALLHDTERRPEEFSHYKNVNSWWRGTGVCASKPWTPAG